MTNVSLWLFSDVPLRETNVRFACDSVPQGWNVGFRRAGDRFALKTGHRGIEIECPVMTLSGHRDTGWSAHQKNRARLRPASDERNVRTIL